MNKPIIDGSALIRRPATRRDFLKGSAALFGAVAGGTLLAGCGDSGSSNAAKPSAAPSLIKPAGTVTLNLWTWAWPEEPLASRFTKAFETAHPEIKLNIKKFPFPDYETALRTAVPNGTAGDVLHLTTGSMLRQYSNFLEPLDGLAEQAYGADWSSQFLGGSVEEIQNSVPEGVGTLALPLQYSVGGVMWVNRAVLSKVGAGVPKSYEEYLALSKALQGKGLIGATWGAKDNWPNTDYLVQFSSQFKPGAIAAAEAGEISFADESIVAGLDFMKRTLSDGLWNKAPFATTAFPDAYNFFLQDKAATAALGTWGTSFLAEGTHMQDWAAFLWPKLPDAPSNNWLDGNPSGVPDGSSDSPVRPWRTVNIAMAMKQDLDNDKRYAASKFIEFWCSEEGQKVGSAQWTDRKSVV